ncbi:OLC1v1016728C3 [Oldenlandia corymbosa var. corymbosa]|uniref:Protein TIC 22, chloroplastic n=1 Tax=Oldenlandia corymbosa var. corymbosa TaxID=529605 RepID=A0AAV1E7T8_OLDCO|nr:OLC1v1016728C3 [Oldenlandia corymbosa var. corymbosa]
MAQALMIKSQSSETVTFFLLRPPTFLHKISSFKKRITEMEPPASSVGPAPNPFQSLSAFIQQQTCRLGAELASRLDETKRFTSKFAANFPAVKPSHASASPLLLPFASVTKSQPPATREGKVSSANSASAAAAATPTLSSDYVAKTLAGTSVYTVSNTNNEFVLISDPNSAKSIGLLCFRYEDAQAFLAQVRSTKGGLRGGAKVVPITLEQVYMLKVEGIAFRFLPDPVQIKNALELKASDTMSGFDGVPVFQSDLLVVKKKKRRYLPVYFRKEDIEKELSMVSRSRGVAQPIVVGSLENVLKKMETSERNSGWEDLIFVPPGKSHSQHIQEVAQS